MVPLGRVAAVQLLLSTLGTGGLNVVDEPNTSAQGAQAQLGGSGPCQVGAVDDDQGGVDMAHATDPALRR
jgi:hypothetical protein